VIAYLDGEPVGWAAVHPRNDTSFARNRLIPQVDELDVWSLWCFRVRPGYRKQGISHALIDGAVAYAKERGGLRPWRGTRSTTAVRRSI
jgi:GNAT superfamily N-acetyltransferase